MKLLTTFALSMSILGATLTGAMAEATYTKGVVKKVDTEAGKVTIIHEALVDLEMPAMTMVFVLSEPALAQQLAQGDEIEFTADRVNGKLTVTAIR